MCLFAAAKDSEAFVEAANAYMLSFTVSIWYLCCMISMCIITEVYDQSFCLNLQRDPGMQCQPMEVLGPGCQSIL